MEQLGDWCAACHQFHPTGNSQMFLAYFEVALEYICRDCYDSAKVNGLFLEGYWQ
jgi:hypothetical protein